MPMSKVITTLQDHGNTSAASIPLALDHAVKTTPLKLVRQLSQKHLVQDSFGAALSLKCNLNFCL